MKAHFVTFLSPGTLAHKKTTKSIDSWNVETAAEMTREITESHNSKPFAFYFSTRERRENDRDSREAKRSGRYYLGGEIQTIDDVRERNDPGERVLLSNMEYSGWDRIIIINRNSRKIVQPLEADDIVLEFEA